MKTVIHIVSLIIIILLILLLVRSISKPINFKKEKTKRYDKVITDLKDIRKAQIAYKDIYGKFTGDFDTLTNFVKNDSMPLVRQIGMLPDTLTEIMALDMGLIITIMPEDKTEEELLAEGYLIRDTVKICVLDSLFGAIYPIDSIKYIPFSNGVEYKLGAGVFETGSKVKVQVFEASAENFTILNGLNRQLIINLNDGKDFPGLKVGSLTEATNNAGNWE
ncbi:MAG: hypothetical protein KAT68_09540 [Bacteroidales bacterium]|nr:hypothetical protein [Bacteroidales bacterium]